MAGNSASPSATAQVVGNAFVNQYYNVLHQSPQVVHRFYTDASHLTRAEAGAAGAVDMAHTQDQIHQKVMSADYSEFKAEIKTVDSQDSLTGGVLVLVTGSLSTKSTGKRNFVQSFFLAPQEKGYFVLNDVFRYLDDEVQTKSVPSLNGVVPEATPVVQQAPEPVVEQPAPAPVPEVVREVTPPPAPEPEATAQEVFDDEGPTGAEEEEHTGPVPVEDTTTPVIEEPESPMVRTTPMKESHPLVQEPEQPVGEQPKKSYASILRVFGAPLPPKVAQPVAERPAVSAAPAPAVAAPTQDNLEDAAPSEITEVDGRSVYVKNLPTSITASELETKLAEFGAVKPNGVNVKSQKLGVCYAFVEFEDATSAQNAIAESPVQIQGRSVYIEEKKPMGRVPRRTNDGRSDRPYRTDRNDRGEGARGRGAYGGRNPGRGGGQEMRERDGNRGGGRGGVPSRGGFPNSNNGGERRQQQQEGQRPPRRNNNPSSAPPPQQQQQPSRSNGAAAPVAAE